MKSLTFLAAQLAALTCLAQDPYVFYTNDSVIIQSPQHRAGMPNDKNNITLAVPAPDGKSFVVKLNKNLTDEPTVFNTNAKLLVLSDIEGEFTAFKKLMLQHKVIDSACNWLFGKNRLVLVGDHFDRGAEVIPYLWLLYKLDHESKKSGGYVHIILGNHDIMNMNGDFRYVQQKYFTDAKAMGKEYAELFTANTALGRWLRTKNIIEKINYRLFVHGGISPEVLQTGMNIEEINRNCRPYYDQQKVPDSLVVFFSGRTSPFWYRGYFKEPLAAEAHIDSTLQYFGVKQIVVGHSIVDSIKELYNGKVLAVDVNHHEGDSEAILLKQE